MSVLVKRGVAYKNMEGMRVCFVGVKGLIVKDSKVLLLKRSGERPFWDAPGGRVDAGETTTIQTLLRELKEELPSITNIAVGSLLNAHVLSKNIRENVGLTLLFYKVDADLSDAILLSSEHSEYKWMTYDEAEANGSEGIPEAVAVLRRIS